MSDSDTNSSEFFEPGSDFPHPIGDLLGLNGRSNTFKRLKHAIQHDSDSDDNLGADIFDDGEELDPLALLEGFRFDRAQGRYHYDGDVLTNLNNANEDATKNWNAYPVHWREERWLSMFRMEEVLFDELFLLLEPHMRTSYGCGPGAQGVPKRDKVLVTLHFLAHTPTLRAMSALFGIPHSTLCKSVLHPTVREMERVLCVLPDSKQVKFPRSAEALKAVMAGFASMHSMPCCIGAIDGSLIPMMKPTSKQSGGDRDAFWVYKGYCSSLLLTIVDAAGSFLYVNAGAPGSIGDAGLWARTSIKQQFDEGLTDVASIKLRAGLEELDVSGYLVADSAFPTGKYIMKCLDYIPQANTPESKYNRCVINARRGVECAFGRLKGRWVFCKKNTFYNAPDFTRSAILVCTALHNFLQARNGLFDPNLFNNEVLEVIEEPGQVQVDGEELQSFLVKWCGENT